MDLEDYQNAARSTAMYMKVNSSQMIYPALGLIGECGEVAEKIKKSIRDDDGEMTDERRDGIKKELGDVMWYSANICCDTGMNLSKIYSDPDNEHTVEISRIIMPRLILRMNRHASSIAAALEKWHYTFYCRSEESSKFPEIPKHLGYVLCCIEEIAFRCGFTLEEICIGNIDKLQSRKRRGTMGGSGDNR